MSFELDINSLLEPFDGEFRGGTDLRADDDPTNDYRQIRDARNEARDAERKADDSGETSSEALRCWRTVWDDGQDYLKSCGKDLEIVAYMIEASIRLHGFEGLAQSMQLTHDLVENFWNELLPTPDEDGLETTLLPISRLNGEAITYPLMRVPVTSDGSVGEMLVWQYAQAQQLESLNAEEREVRVSGGAITLEVFRRAVAETPTDFYLELIAQIERAQSAVTALDELLNDKAGDEVAPNLSRFTAGLKDAEKVIQAVAGDRLTAASEAEDDAQEAEAGDAAAVTGGGGGAPAGRVRGEISTRDEAFELLEKVAVWFERHEPQSILPSEIRKAKRRGRMTPEELYNDLISDSTVREQLFRDVGIEPVSDSSSEY